MRVYYFGILFMFTVFAIGEMVILFSGTDNISNALLFAFPYPFDVPVASLRILATVFFLVLMFLFALIVHRTKIAIIITSFLVVSTWVVWVYFTYLIASIAYGWGTFAK